MHYNKYQIAQRDNDLYVIDDFLTTDEIATYLEYVKKQSHASTEQGSPKVMAFNNHTNFFNGKIKDLDSSQLFFEKLEKVNLWDSSDQDWKPWRACDFIFMANYTPGASFSLHLDIGCHCKFDEKSYQTLLIYLNDDYEGGETTFFNADFEKVITVKPKKGRAILFKIDLWHQAEKVTEGEKSWIGTEIVWKR